MTGAVQDESLLQEDGSKWGPGSAGRQANGRFEASLKLVSGQFRKQRFAVWAAGRGSDPSFTAMVFEPCAKACCKRTQASGELAVQEGKQMECLKLV